MLQLSNIAPQRVAEGVRDVYDRDELAERLKYCYKMSVMFHLYYNAPNFIDIGKSSVRMHYDSKGFKVRFTVP